MIMDSRIEELEKKINDLRRRLPAHSVKPSMVQELEELEEELESLRAGDNENTQGGKE